MHSSLIRGNWYLLNSIKQCNILCIDRADTIDVSAAIMVLIDTDEVHHSQTMCEKHYFSLIVPETININEHRELPLPLLSGKLKLKLMITRMISKELNDSHIKFTIYSLSE